MPPPTPPPVSRARRLLVPAAALVVFAAAAAAFLPRFYADPSFVRAHDFLTYWGAGRLFVTGGNPYDGAELLAVQKAAGRHHDYPTSMWYPPWAYSLVGPFGLLDARTAQLLWVVGQFVLIVLAAGWAWRLYGGDRDRTWVAWGLAALAQMTAQNAIAGQASGWGLVAVVGFLAAAVRGNAPLAALAALGALKPHILVPFWILLVLDATQSRAARRRLAWGAGTGLVALAVPLIVYPEIWTLYRKAMTAPAADGHIPLSAWEPPLVGYWVRAWVDPTAFWIQFVPTVLVAAATPVYWWVRRRNWDWRAEMPTVLFAGLLAAPYGAWDYDLVLLLIPVVAAAVRLSKCGDQRLISRALMAWLVFTAAAHVSLVGRHDVWMTPAVLALYVWVSRATRPTANGVNQSAEVANRVSEPARDAEAVACP